MTDPTTNPLDDDGPRTLAWYACHGFYEDGRLYSQAPDQGFANAPAVAAKVKILAEAGLHDLVPTASNMRELLTEHVAWQALVDQSWKHYEAARGTVHEVLHWVLGTMMKDPTLDQDLLRLVFELAPGHEAIRLVSNQNCPDDVMRFYLGAPGGKQDPANATKGGEIVLFMLHNRTLAPRYIDEIVRKCRKVGTQKRALEHANISRDALVYLTREGKSETVKRFALREMQKRGMLAL